MATYFIGSTCFGIGKLKHVKMSAHKTSIKLIIFLPESCEVFLAIKSLQCSREKKQQHMYCYTGRFLVFNGYNKHQEVMHVYTSIGMWLFERMFVTEQMQRKV